MKYLGPLAVAPIHLASGEKRRTKRFKLQLPVSVIRLGRDSVVHGGSTENISSGGVLFVAGREPTPGVAIEYIVTLNREGPYPVKLRCIGKVVRANRCPNGRGFQVAATLDSYEFVRGDSTGKTGAERQYEMDPDAETPPPSGPVKVRHVVRRLKLVR